MQFSILKIDASCVLRGVSWTTFRLLQNNNITGPIPSELGKLPKLQTLDLSDNYFSGEIPPSLGHLRSLQYM